MQSGDIRTLGFRSHLYVLRLCTVLPYKRAVASLHRKEQSTRNNTD